MTAERVRPNDAEPVAVRVGRGRQVAATACLIVAVQAVLLTAVMGVPWVWSAAPVMFAAAVVLIARPGGR
jgi:hypothetical protein